MKLTVQGNDMIVHVNRQHIGMNAKDGGNRPVYTLKDHGVVMYAREVNVEGKMRFVYNGEQLRCGARAWIEIAEGSVVELIDPMTFQQARDAGFADPKAA